MIKMFEEAKTKYPPLMCLFVQGNILFLYESLSSENNEKRTPIVFGLSFEEYYTIDTVCKYIFQLPGLVKSNFSASEIFKFYNPSIYSKSPPFPAWWVKPTRFTYLMKLKSEK